MLFNTLKDQSVRFTVKTHSLENAWLTIEDYVSDLVGDDDIIKGQVMFSDGVNVMGRENQVLCEIKKIEVFKHEWKTLLEIKNIEFNDGLEGYIVTIQDDRIVQVQFSKIDNRLDGRYGQFRAEVDVINEYGYDLTLEERELFDDWLRTSDTILNHEDYLEQENSEA